MRHGRYCMIMDWNWNVLMFSSILEVARQRVHDCQHLINKLRLDMQVLDAGVKKMKQDTEVTTKELEILQTEICAI